jgi:hypothetical protein
VSDTARLRERARRLAASATHKAEVGSETPAGAIESLCEAIEALAEAVEVLANALEKVENER